MTLRKFIFWLHLIAGVFAGIVIFVMSVTGVLLAYQKQMTEWADRDFWPAAATASGPQLPVSAVVAKAAEKQAGSAPTAVTFYSNPAAPAMVAAGQNQNVFVNLQSGEAIAGGSTRMRSFFRTVTEWHRYMGAGGESRPLGKAITGACNLAFLFIVASGIYLWFPRTWTRQSLRNITWFRGSLRGKARDFNWHNVFGFWTAVPLFLVVLSGVVISYPWASNLVYTISGSPAPVRNGGGGGGGRGGNANAQAAPAAPGDYTQLDALLARVQQEEPGWRTINLRLPSATDRQVTFSIDKSFGGRPQMRSTIVFDVKSGEIARRTNFQTQTTGERARSWMRFVHTGEFYGMTGQTIAGIASAAGAVLVFTGISLAIRRLLAWLGRRGRTREAIPTGRSAEAPLL